jgi:hypothetical protein
VFQILLHTSTNIFGILVHFYLFFLCWKSVWGFIFKPIKTVVGGAHLAVTLSPGVVLLLAGLGSVPCHRAAGIRATPVRTLSSPCRRLHYNRLVVLAAGEQHPWLSFVLDCLATPRHTTSIPTDSSFPCAGPSHSQRPLPLTTSLQSKRCAAVHLSPMSSAAPSSFLGAGFSRSSSPSPHCLSPTRAPLCCQAPSGHG